MSERGATSWKPLPAGEVFSLLSLAGRFLYIWVQDVFVVT